MKEVALKDAAGDSNEEREAQVINIAFLQPRSVNLAESDAIPVANGHL